MKTFAILILFAMCGNVIAQNKLMGFVTEQNSGKKPVENVTIKSFGANPIISSSKGDFILTFQGFEAGKNIVVRAEKEGWELVNEKEMNTFVPLNPNEKPLKIIVCKAGTLAKAKSKYYETFEENLFKEFTKLKAKNFGNEKELARLEEDYARTQKQLNELADEYSRINLDDANEKELKAIKLFNEGKFNEFIELKQSIVSETQVDKALKNKQEATKTINNADSTIALYFKSQKDIAKTQMLQFKYKEAEETYLKVYQKDSTNFSNTFALSFFLDTQNQYKTAIKFYKICLTLAKLEINSAEVNNNLGILYHNIKDYVASLAYYRKSMQIYEKLGDEEGIVDVLHNMSITYRDMQDYNSAISLIKKEIEINEKKSTNNINKLNSLASSYNNLGRFNATKGDHISSLSAYQKTAKLYDSLVNLNIKINDYDIAILQNNIGIAYKNTGNFGLAIESYTNALILFEKLAYNNNDRYIHLVGSVYNNLGNIYRVEKKYNESSKSHIKAFKIFNILSSKNPEVYEIEFCKTVILLGLLYKEASSDTIANLLSDHIYRVKQILQKYNNWSEAKKLLTEIDNLIDFFKSANTYSEILSYQNKIQITKDISEKINLQQKINDNYLYLIRNNYTNFSTNWANGLAVLSRFLIQNKTFLTAENIVKVALNPSGFVKTKDYDEKIEWANTNLALALLFQGKYVEAERIYAALKDKPYNNATYRETFLADLDELEKVGITHPDVVKIRKILKK